MLLDGMPWQHTSIQHCAVHRGPLLAEPHRVVFATGATAFKTDAEKATANGPGVKPVAPGTAAPIAPKPSTSTSTPKPKPTTTPTPEVTTTPKPGFSAVPIVPKNEAGGQLVDPVFTGTDIKTGGTVIGGQSGKGEPDDIPGVGLYASILDTEGNRISILQPKGM